MDRLLARLDRRLGKFAIENLTTYVVGGMGLVFVLGYVRPEFLEFLRLDIDGVKRGEVWRLVTYLFIPTSMSLWWIFFALSYMLFIGRSLEAEWGAFKLNVYYLVGMIGTTVGAVIVGHGVGNEWLNYSLLFALATLFPDFEISLIVFPIKVKWLGLLSVALLAYAAFEGGWGTRVAIVCALSNYLLFFGGHWVARLRERNMGVRQNARRTGFRENVQAERVVSVGRACAICGARQEDGADIRVCSCDKCGRPRNLCLEHARNH